MSGAAVVGIPSARSWRTRLRRGRRHNHERSVGDVFTDLYMVLWLLAVYGGALVSSVRRHLATSPTGGGLSPTASWVVLAALVTGAGLAWEALRALGPLMATPAEQAWGVSTPVDRRAWIFPRFVSLVLGGAAVAAAVGAATALLTSVHLQLGWAALAGGVLGAGGVSGLAFAQPGPARGPRSRWPWARVLGLGLLLAGVALALTAVVGKYGGLTLAPPPLPSLILVAAVGGGVALVATSAAWRSLSRLDLSSMSSGAQVASAAMTATVWLDPSLLSGVLEVRRWRSVGKVRSRPFRAGRLGRVWVLMEAEAHRQLRRSGGLAVWGGLALALYALSVVAPTSVGVVRVILAYFAAGRLMGGLRALSSSAGLRRALGGSELEQRLAHVVIPFLGMALWWAATAPADSIHSRPLDVFLVAGVVAAAYRAASRPPMSYGGFVFETPMGLFPLELVMQLTRGLDLLGAVVVVRLLAGG